MRKFSPVFLNEKTQEWELVENKDRVVTVEFSNGKWVRYEEAYRYKSAIEQLSNMLQSDDFDGLLKIISEYVMVCEKCWAAAELICSGTSLDVYTVYLRLLEERTNCPNYVKVVE